MNKLQILVDALRNGGSVCLTGEMPECDRLEITNVFAAMGLKMQGSPSRRLTFLLVADGAKQEKINRALELGIPIFSTQEFWNAVDLVYPPSE